jgi:hypothetical protein
MTLELSSDVDISHASLRRANRLKQKLLPLRSIFIATNQVLDNVESLMKSTPNADPDMRIVKQFRNFRHEALAYAENTRYLLQFSERIRMQISDTLSLKNQDTSLQQTSQVFELAQCTARDSLSIRIMTFLMLGYLPSSFVAVSVRPSLVMLDQKLCGLIISAIP